MATDHFDVIVLGAGSAGENAAGVAAQHGLSTVIVERELVGGECSYWACMPSKALLRAGEVQDAASRVPGFSGGTIDAAAVLARRDSLASHWDDAGQVDWLDGVGVSLRRGHGRIVAERTVEVEGSEGSIDRLVASRAVIVATGSSAALPPIEGLEAAGPWDSRDATSADEVPRRLLIIGGGAVGVEMAQAWRSLGSEEVTVVEINEHLLAKEEPFAGAQLQESFDRLGIRVLTTATTTQVTRDQEGGPVTVRIDLANDTETTIEADEVLVATGRNPNTTDLGLETIGLEAGEYIEVDDHLVARGVEGGWLYAVGDVTGRALLTHAGKYQARIAGAHVAGIATTAWGDRLATPRVVFTSPQVAAVGMIESAAREAGIDVKTVSYDIGHTAGASALGAGYEGTCKLVIDGERRVLVGATFVGPHTGELIHAATIAIVGEVPIDVLWHAVPSFPTLSEVWLRLLEAYRDEYGHQFA